MDINKQMNNNDLWSMCTGTDLVIYLEKSGFESRKSCQAEASVLAFLQIANNDVILNLCLSSDMIGIQVLVRKPEDERSL